MTPGARQTLLLVDADPQSLRVLDVSLKKAGYEVLTAQGGAVALELLAEHPVDLVISDTHMPQMDGFELCRRIKERPDWARIPFIFLSSRKTIEDKIRGLEIGVEDYLTKPVYIREITTRVRMLLQRRERERLESRRDTRTRFAGELNDIGVVDLLQTLEVNRKSGIVHIANSDGRQGAIYFRDGHVIDAECGRLGGVEAVYRLFAWSEGNFEVEFKNIRRRDVIELSGQALLMEGMRRLDEWTRLVEVLPPLETVFQVDYHVLAERLADIPDEVNALLRLFDGRRSILQVIEDSDFPDLEAISILSRLQADHIIHPAQAAPRPQTSEPRQTRLGRLEHWLADSPWSDVNAGDADVGARDEHAPKVIEPEVSRAFAARTPSASTDAADNVDLLQSPMGRTLPGFAPVRLTPEDFADESTKSGSELDALPPHGVGPGAQPQREIDAAAAVDASEGSPQPSPDTAEDFASDDRGWASAARLPVLPGRPEEMTPLIETAQALTMSDDADLNHEPLRELTGQAESFAATASGSSARPPNGHDQAPEPVVWRDDETSISPSPVRRAGSARLEEAEPDLLDEAPVKRRGLPLFLAAVFVGVVSMYLVVRNRGDSDDSDRVAVEPASAAGETEPPPGPATVVAPPAAQAPRGSNPASGSAASEGALKLPPVALPKQARTTPPSSAGEPTAAPGLAAEPAAPAPSASQPAASAASPAQAPPAAPASPAQAPPAAPASPAQAPAAPTPTVAAAGSQTASTDVVAACHAAYESRRVRAIMDACRAALDQHPKNPKLMVMLAYADFDRGRNSAALRWARQAVALDPKLADAYLFIGEIEQDAGNVPAAKSAYSRYLELAPRGPYAADLRAILRNL